MSDLTGLLQELVGRRRYVWLYVRDRSFTGFVVATNDSLVLLHCFHDFFDNGHMILRASAITDVGHDERSLRFFEGMLLNEGVIPSAGTVPLDSLQHALTAIKEQNELVFLDRGLFEPPDAEFHLGGILDVGAEVMTMRHLTSWGAWETGARTLFLRDLERVEFGSPYLRMLKKYSSPWYARIARA